jgi:hypothetical protein
MSSSNKNSEEPLSGGTVQTSLCCIQEFPKDEENKFRAFVHNFKRTKRKIRFISCLLTFFWCSQTANNVVVIHDNTTQPTHPSTPQKYLGVYVAISCCWVLTRFSVSGNQYSAALHSSSIGLSINNRLRRCRARNHGMR